MFKFLRFEIGGVSALLWLLIFVAPYLNIDALTRVDSMKFFTAVLGSVTFAIPLGNYIHQFTDSLFNPFRRRRLFFWPRAVTSYMTRELDAAKDDYRDKLFQAVVVFSKASEIQIKRTSKRDERTLAIRADVIREEISNRYSYYYARIENGLVAPIVGFAAALFARKLFEQSIYVLPDPVLSPFWLYGFVTVVCFGILWRIPQLFRELDDLEIGLVHARRLCWPKVSG